MEELIEFASKSSGRIRLIAEEHHIDFDWHPNKSNNLLVFFTAAIRRSPNFQLPAFSGKTAIGKVDANILMISDPSLELSDVLTLAWYAGHEDFRLQPILGEILKQFSKYFGKKRVVLYGGSGAGFAAIYYSTYIPDSYAIAANPQTDISKYYNKSVMKYIETCFPSVSVLGEIEEMLEQTGIEYDLSPRFVNSSSKLIYLQNNSDTHHINNHFKPFMHKLGLQYELVEGVRRLNDRIIILSGNWGEGHKPPPKDLIFRLLRCIFKENAFEKLLNLKTNKFIYYVIRKLMR